MRPNIILELEGDSETDNTSSPGRDEILQRWLFLEVFLEVIYSSASKLLRPYFYRGSSSVHRQHNFSLMQVDKGLVVLGECAIIGVLMLTC